MKLRQYFVKLKISKSFNTGKWERCIEYFARLFVLASVIVLAMWTIFTSPLGITWFAKAFLTIFIIAAAVVFYFEARHLFRKQPSNQQESTQIPTDIERAGRNKWISIGLLVLVAIVIGLFFLAQQLPATTRGYQTFFTAFAAVAALGTGIALVFVAYQQYKLRQTEHSLLYEPQISISSGAPIPGKAVYNNELYPYRIEWATFIYNSSNIPVLIKDMAVAVRIANRDSFKEEIYLNPIYCTILEPESLEPPFQVTLGASQKIKWVIEGRGAGHEFEYLSDNSNSELFELIFRVRTSTPEEPSKPILLEHFSIPFVVSKNVPWGDKSSVLI